MVDETPQPRKRIGLLKRKDGTAASLSSSDNEEGGLFSKTSLGFSLGNTIDSDSDSDVSLPSTGNLKRLTGSLLSGSGRLNTSLFNRNTLGNHGLETPLTSKSDSDTDSDMEKKHSPSVVKEVVKKPKNLSKPGKAARILEMLGYESDDEVKSGNSVPLVLDVIPPLDESIPKQNPTINTNSSSDSSSEEESNDLKVKNIKTPRKTAGGLKSATKRDLLEMHKETERLIRQSGLAAPIPSPKAAPKRLNMSAFLQKFQKPVVEAVPEIEDTPNVISEEDSTSKSPPAVTSNITTTESQQIENILDSQIETIPPKVKIPNTLSGFLLKPLPNSPRNSTATTVDKGKQVERHSENEVDTTLSKPSIDKGKEKEHEQSTNTQLADPFVTKKSNIVVPSYQASDSDSELEIIENPKDLAIQGLLKVVQKRPRKSPVKPVCNSNTAAFTSPSRIRNGNTVTQRQLNRKLLNTIQSQSAKKRIEDIEKQLAKQYAPDKEVPDILSDEEGILLSGEDEEEYESGSEIQSGNEEQELSESEANEPSHDLEFTKPEKASIESDEAVNVQQRISVDEDNSSEDELPPLSSLRARSKPSMSNRVVIDDEDEESVAATLPTQPHNNGYNRIEQIDEEGFLISSLPKSQDSQECYEDSGFPTQYITEEGFLTLHAPTQETILCTPSQDSSSATQLVNSSLTSISQSPPHTWSRLQQGRSSESVENSIPENSKPMTEMDAFALLGQAATNEYNKSQEASLVTQLKPKMKTHSAFIDAEAEEEEDEFGVKIDDDEEEEESDEDIMIPTLDEDEEFDHQDIKELHLQQMKEKDRKDITNLMNDIATGGLRKRRRLGFDDGKGYDLDDEFSDDENLNRRSRLRLIKRRTNTDDFLDRIAKNPETAAFARAAVGKEDVDDPDPFDHVEDNAEDVFSMFRSNHSVSVEEIYSREISMEVDEMDDTVEEVNEEALHNSEARIYYEQVTTSSTSTSTSTKSVSFDFSQNDDFEGRDLSILRLIKNRGSALASSVEDPNDDTYESWMNPHKSGVSFLETNPDRAKRFVSMVNEDKILGEVVARKEFNHKNMAFRSASKTKIVSLKSSTKLTKGKAPERSTIKELAQPRGSSAIDSPTNYSTTSQPSRSELVTEPAAAPCPLLKVLSRYDSFQ
ncbi:hypothetical protein K7432_013609 [Basidiobolus ranarum]|uniref:DNA replication checkpoint mediator MRC1 domain-containing protein n=1 Tax=Basidiobolus ranarum TaxID=34480 RepID=A0ABR2VQR6_9FUNG